MANWYQSTHLGKPGACDRGVSGMMDSPQTCRSRLAGDGDFTDAFAGKPGSYGSRGGGDWGLTQIL
ncbi:hypothetical protein EMIT0P44_420018 [Pseudomonas sp. IT-P44]